MTDSTFRTLAPGLYELPHAVDNPVGDRRVSRDWARMPTWQQGMRFEIKELKLPAYLDAGDVKVSHVRAALGHLGLEWVMFREAQYQALAAHLLPVPADKLGNLLAINNGRAMPAEWLIATLLDQGKITLEDVQGAVNTTWALDGDAQRAFAVRHGLEPGL